MATTIFNNQCTNNYSTLVEKCKNATAAVKQAKNVMFWVNVLNKLARKNEFIDNTDVAELGRIVRAYSRDKGIETKDYFNAYLFTKVNGVPCYKKTIHKKASAAFAVDVDVTIWIPVTLSDVGLIRAYKYILGIDAKQADKAGRNSAKQARKQANKQQADAKKQAKQALKKQQADARELFAAGKMCVEEFATIMAKVA